METLEVLHPSGDESNQRIALAQVLEKSGVVSDSLETLPEQALPLRGYGGTENKRLGGKGAELDDRS